MIGRRGFGLGLAAAGIAALTPSTAFAAERVIVFAAASLKTALDAVAASWTADTGKAAAISYAASSALAKQIEQGAPADLFISADLDWMTYLAERDLIVRRSETRLLGNEIVLIAPQDSAVEAKIEAKFPLAALLGDGRLAMGDVNAVPAGKYGKAALVSLGVWDAVESKIAMAENVRAALKLVSTGEAPLGIVYRSDAKSDPDVKVVATFPAQSHPPVVYPAAVTAASKNPDAAEFLGYLRSAKAKALFEEQGFVALAP